MLTDDTSKCSSAGPARPGRFDPGAQFVLVDGRLIARMRGGDGTEDDPPKDPPADGDPPAKDDKKADSDEFDRERALATIKRQRQTEKDLKAKIRELEGAQTQKKDDDDKDRTDASKLQAQLDATNKKLADAEEARRAMTVRLEVERVARRHNFIDEDDVYRLIDRDDIDFDDKDKPLNVEDLVKDLAKAKPHLVKAADNAGNGTDDKNGDAAKKDDAKDDKKPSDRSPNPTPKPDAKEDAPTDEEKRRREREQKRFYSGAI